MLKQRLAQRHANKMGGVLNELGGFNGVSLEKIQAKASKMKQNLVDGSDEEQKSTSTKNSLS